MTWGFIMERVTRIELALSAWEADVLPLNYTRVSTDHRPDGAGARRSLTVPHRRPPVLVPRGSERVSAGYPAAGGPSWGVPWRGGRGSGWGRSAAWRVVSLIP